MSPKGSEPDLMEVDATEFGKSVWHSAASTNWGCSERLKVRFGDHGKGEQETEDARTMARSEEVAL